MQICGGFLGIRVPSARLTLMLGRQDCRFQRTSTLSLITHLDDRPGFKFAMQESGGRLYLYCAHLWEASISILDVTDPRNPVLKHRIEGPGQHLESPGAGRRRQDDRQLRGANRGVGL